MALDPQDLQALSDLMDAKIASHMGGTTVAESSAKPVEPEDTVVRKEAEPWYYVHLANGQVLETQDNSSTDFDGVQVIGRYQKHGEEGK